MGTGESAVIDWVRSVLPWGAALVAVGALLLLPWICIRYLSERWKREAAALTEHIHTSLMVFEERLTALQTEASAYSPDLAPPYRDRVRHLQDRLQAISECLSTANDCVIEIPTPPLTIPATQSAQVTYLLWSEPRARHARRAKLRALDQTLRDLEQDFASSDNLLKQLRRTPLETAELARELHAHLEAAFEILDGLQTAGLRGESLDRVAHGLDMEAQSVASLPPFLFDQKESHILRRAQPIPISQVWQALVELKPAVDGNLETLEEWRRELDDLGHQLAGMRLAMTNASARLTEANAQIDLTELTREWQVIQAQSEEIERRLKTPTPEDLADFDDVNAVTEQADAIVAKLATLEALRLSLNLKLSENEQRIESL